jgi:hypothetical protein
LVGGKEPGVDSFGGVGGAREIRLVGTAGLFTGSSKVVINGEFEGGHHLNYHFDGKKSFEAITKFVKEAV